MWSLYKIITELIFMEQNGNCFELSLMLCYVQCTDNNGSCDSLHCSVIAYCTLVKKSLQVEKHSYSLAIHTIIVHVIECNKCR